MEWETDTIRGDNAVASQTDLFNRRMTSRVRLSMSQGRGLRGLAQAKGDNFSDRTDASKNIVRRRGSGSKYY